MASTVFWSLFVIFVVFPQVSFGCGGSGEACSLLERSCSCSGCPALVTMMLPSLVRSTMRHGQRQAALGLGSLRCVTHTPMTAQDLRKGMIYIHQDKYKVSIFSVHCLICSYMFCFTSYVHVYFTYVFDFNVWHLYFHSHNINISMFHTFTIFIVYSTFIFLIPFVFLNMWLIPHLA